MRRSRYRIREEQSPAAIAAAVAKRNSLEWRETWACLLIVS